MARPVVLIAGASQGIGAACVESFAHNGWTVVGVSRSGCASTASADLSICEDLTQEGAAERVVTAVRERFGRLDTLVHSVGMLESFVPVAEISWQRWQDMFTRTIGTAVGLIRAAMPSLKDAGSDGSFVAISSIARTMPFPGGADYSVAKAGLSNLAVSMARELAPTGGRANAIEPAVIDTPLIDSYRHLGPGDWHLLGRIGDPQEVADFAEYLASPKAKWLTGQYYVLDGGLFSTPPGQ